MDASDGRYPMMLAEWKPYYPVRAISPIGGSSTGSVSGIFRCPLDRKEGRSGMPLSDRREPLSYSATWFLWEGDTGMRAWETLASLETNPILFRCYFHDDRVRERLQRDVSDLGTFQRGLALVARKDGSVGLDRRSDSILDASGQLDVKRSVWSLATTVPCPDSVCDGKSPDTGPRL